MKLRRSLFKIINRVVALLAIVMVIASSMAFQSKAATISNFTIRVTYGQTEARSQLAMINKFRASSENWYWNSDDATKSTGYTSALYYDYDLEKVAMLRAAEIAYYYSHTRPNGDICWGAYTDAGYGEYGSAENIAYGYPSSEAVFTAWREDDDSYSYQGHRRNMLGEYQAFAVGHVVYKGRHYWVQEFSTRTQNTTANIALDSEKDVVLTVSDTITPNADVTSCADDQHSYVYGEAIILEQTASYHKLLYDTTCKNCRYFGWTARSGSHDGYPGKPCSVCGYVESTPTPTKVPTPTPTKAPTPTPTKVPTVTGWALDSNGKYYVDSNGARVKNSWKQIGDKWYHFNVSGYMESNKWIGNYWLLSNGVMATNQWVDGDKYYVGADGAWDSSKKKVTTGWKSDNTGKWYVNSNGTYPVNKWQQIDGKWYHFDSRGYMESNKWIGNYWLLTNGVMATNAWVDNGKYYVGADGAWDSSKKKVSTGWRSDNIGSWYVNANGSYPTNKWQQIDGFWYYFDSRGYMESNKWIGNYYLLSNGKMATSQWIDGYYLKADGNKAVGEWYNGYYFKPDGRIAKDEWVGNCYFKSDGRIAKGEWVDNGKYYVDANGYWVPGKTK